MRPINGLWRAGDRVDSDLAMEWRGMRISPQLRGRVDAGHGRMPRRCELRENSVEGDIGVLRARLSCDK